MTLVLDTDEVQMLRDILSMVVFEHTKAMQMYHYLNSVPGIKAYADDRGYSGQIDYKEPTRRLRRK